MKERQLYYENLLADLLLSNPDYFDLKQLCILPAYHCWILRLDVLVSRPMATSNLAMEILYITFLFLGAV